MNYTGVEQTQQCLAALRVQSLCNQPMQSGALGMTETTERDCSSSRDRVIPVTNYGVERVAYTHLSTVQMLHEGYL